MKEDALTYFKGNVEYNIKDYLSENNSWIYEKYVRYKKSDESPFEELNIYVDDFSLDMSSDRPESTDYNNVKILYNNLKNLSNTQATDERLWSGLSHSNFYEFMVYRLKLNEEKIKAENILGNYFFKHGNKRSLILHSLARLWWVGRLLYDENRKDHFYALNYLKTDFGTKVLSLFSSNFTNNPAIARAILISAYEIEEDGEKISREKYLELIRYVNLLGGIVILDYLSEEELTNKIKKHYYEVNV
jgi:hypothetical protein